MPFTSGIGWPELLIVFAIVLLLFGPKRLPGMGKALGSGLREFKDSISGRSKGEEDDDDEKPELTAAQRSEERRSERTDERASEPAPAEPRA